MSIPTLTPFESQVMQVIGSLYENPITLSAPTYLYDDVIASRGASLFGTGWGGTKNDGYYFPVILRFFGRLRAKGLLERHEHEQHNSSKGWGMWELSDLGRELLGLPS